MSKPKVENREVLKASLLNYLKSVIETMPFEQTPELWKKHFESQIENYQKNFA